MRYENVIKRSIICRFCRFSCQLPIFGMHLEGPSSQNRNTLSHYELRRLFGKNSRPAANFFVAVKIRSPSGMIDPKLLIISRFRDISRPLLILKILPFSAASRHAHSSK